MLSIRVNSIDDMKTINAKEFKELPKREFTSFFNSLSGAKPGFLIGSGHGQDENIAIFNSITHLGASPPLLGFIQRPVDVERNTYANILKYKHYSFNLITQDFYKKAHQTSARYKPEESEFEKVGLTSVYKKNFDCPFVAESPLHILLELYDDVEIKSNNTRLIIGKVVSVSKLEFSDKRERKLDFEKLNGVNISGLSDYYTLHKIESLPYAKVK